MGKNSSPTPQEVVDWAKTLYQTCESTITDQERKEQLKYATMVQRPQDKKFLVKMLDESSQIHDDKILAKRIKMLIDTYGVPEFLSKTDAFLFKMYQSFGHHFDFIAIPIIKKRLRSDTSKIIIDEERPKLTEHLATRFKERIGQNVNLIGEVVLGEAEADKRYNHYLEALESPDINYISIKISGIYAQTHALNYEESIPELIKRLSTLYQKAIDFPYVDEDGVKRPKFINLDMEEYKDAHLTMDLFKQVLSKPEFKNYSAGIVVQSYLPDAYSFQGELLEFAHERVKNGGAPIKMRIVKGCNLDMETVVSSLRGWPNPVLPNKTLVDANYLQILDRGLKPENAKVLHLGMASHNWFTISYAYLLTQKYGTPKDCYSFEMLEGMANHLWRAQSKLGNHVILYTPVVKNENFLNAVSYLVRRMDEQTAPDNFLTHSFNLQPGTEEWKFLEEQFRAAYALKDKLDNKPFRDQDRNKKPDSVPPAEVFVNEPDTDFDRACNQQWQRDIFAKWKKSPSDKPYIIPLQIGTKEVVTEKRHIYKDRCQDDKVTVCEMCMADTEQVKKILEIAEKDPEGWRKTDIEKRHKIMYKAADNLARMRGDLIGCMCAITGKTVVEADVEVSEGIDYARFYTTSMRKFYEMEDIQIKPKGTVLVISPWNFPCAIPIGGIVAGLAAGNTVILKPATVAAPVAWLFAKAFWDAGVPKDALQVCITDRDALNYLTSADAVKHIILTGGTDTAKKIITTNPKKPLSAETGGKNVMILTALGDKGHAIMNAMASAFGNAGQKCSACSILLVQRSIYDSPDFRAKVKDAATSIKVGSVWNPGNIVGPMITNDNEKLKRALKLEKGEEWLVEPKFIDQEKYIMTPGVKIGVKPDSYTFRTELFAPLLSIVPFDTLEEAIKLVNSLEYGLTSGLQSLDEKERKLWRDSIEAGNLYINRGITGAIVNRQPFGGMKQSAFGPGLKAGGPNYCLQFVEIEDKKGSKTDFNRSYTEAYEEEFAHPRDWNKCQGEQNIFRYLPLKSMVLRVGDTDTIDQIKMVLAAARKVGTPLTVSIDPKSPLKEEVRKLGLNDRLKEETTEHFILAIPQYERIRSISENLPDEVYLAAAKANRNIVNRAPSANGRIELVNYIKEQSISYEYHRYGSISDIPPVE